MKFFVLQIFLPALAFAQHSSSYNDDDGPNADTEEVDVRMPILAFLSVLFVVLLGCLYWTYQNNDDNTEGLRSNPQSWVSIRSNSSYDTALVEYKLYRINYVVKTQ